MNEEYLNDCIALHLQSIRDDLLRAVDSAVEKYVVLMESGEKGKLRYIAISFLRSSVASRLDWFRIDLYGEKKLRDVADCHVMWGCEPLTNLPYKRHPFPKDDRTVLGLEMCAQVENQWMEDAEMIFSVLKGAMQEIAKPVKCAFCEDIVWTFGEYFGDNIAI